MKSPDHEPDTSYQPVASADSLSNENELDEGDISLIHWMLTLTPAQRLDAAQDFVSTMMALKDGRKISDLDIYRLRSKSG